ncbi:MAG: hypothetical protein ACI4S3_06245 [Candidatus Gastranaerophilaceae bacterium]
MSSLNTKAMFGMLLLASCVNLCTTTKTMEKAQKIREEVKAYNLPVKEYEAIENNIYKDFYTPPADAALGWQKAADSLKMDAACKKAYMEGAQMVRDSIKVASKIKK